MSSTPDDPYAAASPLDASEDDPSPQDAAQLPGHGADQGSDGAVGPPAQDR